MKIKNEVLQELLGNIEELNRTKRTSVRAGLCDQFLTLAGGFGITPRRDKSTPANGATVFNI